MKLNNLFEAKAVFRLHPSLDSDKYQITNSLVQHSRWKAYSYYEKKMDDIGYIMISLNDDTIIPIARGDEHHRGYDLLYDMQNKWDIDPESFVPVWKLGKNYFFDREDIKPMKVALRKFLAYGGVDGPIYGGNEFKKLMMFSSEFIDYNGDHVNIEHEGLAPVGQRVYDLLNGLGKTIQIASSTDRASITGKAFQEAKTFMKTIYPLYQLSVEPKYYEEFNIIMKNKDLKELENFIFGFNGVKNTIHKYLKEISEQPDEWRKTDLRSLWGDIDLAIAMLGDM